MNNILKVVDPKIKELFSKKINITDIVDDLSTALSDRPLSANQGVVIKGLIDQINNLLASDDVSLDELQELVDYIKANRGDIDSLGIAGVAGLQDALDGKMPKSGLSAFKLVSEFYTVKNDDLGHPLQPPNVAGCTIKLSSVTIDGSVVIASPNDHSMTITHATGMADQNGNIMVSYVLPAYGVAIIGYANGGCSIVNAIPKNLHLNTLTAENQSLTNIKSVPNLGQNQDLFASSVNMIRDINLSLLTNRSFGGGSIGAVSQRGLKLNNGSTDGGMAMVTFNGILGYGGQNGNNKFNIEIYPFTLFWSTDYNTSSGTRMRVMLGQDNANIATPLPDDGSKAGIIFEMESVSTAPFHNRFRLGVAKGGTMYWTDWLHGGNDGEDVVNKGYGYKSYPCSFALSIKSDKVHLTCIAHNSLREGFSIEHPQAPATLADSTLAPNTANLQITNENHNSSGNVPLFLERVQYQNHAF